MQIAKEINIAVLELDNDFPCENLCGCESFRLCREDALLHVPVSLCLPAAAAAADIASTTITLWLCRNRTFDWQYTSFL